MQIEAAAVGTRLQLIQMLLEGQTRLGLLQPTQRAIHASLMLTECDVHLEMPRCNLIDAATQSQQHDVVLPATLQLRQQTLGALVHRHNVGEERLAIAAAQHRRVAEGGVVHEVTTQQIQRFEIACLGGDDLELGLLQATLTGCQCSYRRK